MRSKRPWKKYAKIDRITLNSGDVKFEAIAKTPCVAFVSQNATFESLTECEGFLDAWFAEWWPKQVKSTRRA